jgi:putative membrane protein
VQVDPLKPGKLLSWHVKAGIALAALAGIAGGTALVLYFGLEQVGDAFLTAGWAGLAAMSLAYAISMIFRAIGWRVLFVDPLRHPVFVALWVRQLRESAANVISVVPAAGEVIAARELVHCGLPTGPAIATTVVDLTTEIISQLFFTLLGLGLLAAERPGEPIAWVAMAGLLVSAMAMAGFIVAQRKGMFRILQSLPERLGLTAPFSTDDSSRNIHAAIELIYLDPSRAIVSTVLHLVAWIVGTAESWAALYFMGHPLSFSDVLVIESLVIALRTAAFIVPWAAGVLEGGYVAVGAIFGIGPDVALGLSLLRRARELLTGVPCLAVWQGLELKRLWRSRTRSKMS